MHNTRDIYRVIAVAGIATQVAACTVHQTVPMSDSAGVVSPQHLLDHRSNFHYFMVE